MCNMYTYYVITQALLSGLDQLYISIQCLAPLESFVARIYRILIAHSVTTLRDTTFHDGFYCC